MTYKDLKQSVETTIRMMEDVVDSYKHEESLPILFDDDRRTQKNMWYVEGLMYAADELYYGIKEYDELVEKYEKTKNNYVITSIMIARDVEEGLTR